MDMDCKVNLKSHFLGAVTVGERGQVVIPAEAREELRISPGDKLLVFVPPPHNAVMLVSVDEMREFTENLASFLSSPAVTDASDESETSE